MCGTEWSRESIPCSTSRMSKPGIYRFSQEFGKFCPLGGMFVATDEEVAAAMGRQCRLVGILGKKSTVSCILTDQNLWLVSDIPEIVELFQISNHTNGINPLHYFGENRP